MGGFWGVLDCCEAFKAIFQNGLSLIDFLRLNWSFEANLEYYKPKSTDWEVKFKFFTPFKGLYSIQFEKTQNLPAKNQILPLKIQFFHPELYDNVISKLNELNKVPIKGLSEANWSVLLDLWEGKW